jgi:hypothetical protein
MSRVGFEPTTPAFERAKTFHSLDRAATVIGLDKLGGLKIITKNQRNSILKLILCSFVFYYCKPEEARMPSNNYIIFRIYCNINSGYFKNFSFCFVFNYPRYFFPLP